jgi:DNA-binding XRE family transcriptional regulator
MDWSRTIKAYRAEHKLSQAALADELGVDPRQLRRWESGGTLPKWALTKLGLVREISTDEALIMLVDLCAKMALLTKAGIVIRTSPAHQAAFGYKPADLWGKKYMDIAPPDVVAYAEANGGPENALQPAIIKNRKVKAARPAGQLTGLQRPIYTVSDIYFMHDSDGVRRMLAIATEISKHEYDALPVGPY